MNTKPLTIAMLSLHSSPIGPLGAQDTGGMSVYVRELARGLGAGGHRVDIFTCVGAGKTEIELYPNVRLVHLGAGLKTIPAKEALPENLPQAFDALDTYRQAHGCTYDMVHSHYWLSGMVGLMAREMWRCPHVITFHTLAARKNRASDMENEPDLRLAGERRLAIETDCIVVPVREEGRFLEEAYGARPSGITVVPGGVNLSLFTPIDQTTARQRLNLPKDAKLMLYVGRFAPLKRVDRLIKSVAQLRTRERDVHLTIVGGDDPDDESTLTLKTIVSELQIEGNVRFAGRVDQQTLPLYYSAADLLALPSDYESFGLVLLEAMACGTPVMASRVGIAPTLVEEGINGTLLENSTIDSLVRGIECLTAGDRPAAERIRSTVTPYGWPGIAAAMVDVYVSLLKREAHDENNHSDPKGKALS